MVPCFLHSSVLIGTGIYRKAMKAGHLCIKSQLTKVMFPDPSDSRRSIPRSFSSPSGIPGKGQQRNLPLKELSLHDYNLSVSLCCSSRGLFPGNF